MRDFLRSSGFCYVVAVASIALATLVRRLLDPALGDHLPFPTYFVAVLFVAWYCGLWPSVLALLLGWWAADFFFVAPRHVWVPHGEGVQYHVGTAAYFTVGIASIVICEALRSAQRRAAARGEQLRVTLASIGDAVITTDQEGRVSALNPVAESLTGWAQDEAAGRPLGEVFRIVNQQTRQAVEDPVTKVLAEGKIIGLANHTLLIAKDGTERSIDDSAAPIRNARGEVSGVVLIFRDITERRRLEEELRESEARKAAMVNASLDGIITIDHAGKVIEFNPAAEQTFGYRREDVLGREMAELIIPPPLRESHRRGIARYLATGEGPVLGRRLELTAVRSDGTEFPVELAITRINQHDPPLFTGYVRDISAQVQARLAITESEQRFRQLADAMPQIVWAARPDGHIDYYNERWYEFTGFRRGEYGQQSWEPILHPDDVRRCVDTYFGCIKTEQPYQIEYRFKDRRTGGYRWFLGRAMPVRDGQGQVVRWFGTCTDIDDTKRAEQKTQFLADASAELADLTDPESTLQKVARSAVPTFADWCAVDLLAGDGAWRRVAVTHTDPAKVRLAQELAARYPPRPDDPHGVVQVIRTGKPELVEDIPDALLASAAHDDEHLRILRELGLKSYVCVPLLSRGRALGVLTFVLAESAHRYNAADLRVAEDLARRAAVAVENAELYRALREADRRKDEFLATLAHELRNPLAPVRNALELLRHTEGDGELIEEARSIMERQVSQMVRLIDDLLDVARITRGKLRLRKERVELAAVVNSAVETSRPLVEQMGHELTVTLPPQPVYLDADPVRLAQVLLNLLNNAAKYTEHGGRIGLTAERHGGEAVVTVTDNGIGIPLDKLPHVFEMFAQVDRSLERSQGGLGLGLTLVKRLTEMHGGSVEATSGGPGQGSAFTVRLPVAVGPSGKESPPPSEETTAAPRRRLLVVDDNRDGADSLAMMLRLVGNKVQTAYDGIEAVQAAEVFRPDVVLLDIGLPKLNGYEAARRIRQQPWGEGMVLIAVTGWGQEEDRRRSQEAGFNFHMVKPVEPADLAKLLAAMPTTV